MYNDVHVSTYNVLYMYIYNTCTCTCTCTMYMYSTCSCMYIFIHVRVYVQYTIVVQCNFNIIIKYVLPGFALIMPTGAAVAISISAKSCKICPFQLVPPALWHGGAGSILYNIFWKLLAQNDPTGEFIKGFFLLVDIDITENGRSTLYIYIRVRTICTYIWLK